MESVTFQSTELWMNEVIKNNEDIRKERNSTMHREDDNTEQVESVLPKWLRDRVYSAERVSHDTGNNNNSNITKKTLKKFKMKKKSIKTITKSLSKSDNVLKLFSTLPHKRDPKTIRKGAMWLRNTNIGYALTPSVRERLASGCKLIRVDSDAVLSAQVHSHRVELPHHVYIVLTGMLKQKCKRRQFEALLTEGDCACELPLIDSSFSHDVVTVVGGRSGATILSIPRALYLETARSARRQMLQDRIASLQCCELFSTINSVQLARLALSAKSKQTTKGECIVKQDETINCLMLVVRGSFVCGRSLLQRGANITPTTTEKGNSRDDVQSEQIWTRTKRQITPCITVDHKKRGGYIGEESLFPSFLKTLGKSVIFGGDGDDDDKNHTNEGKYNTKILDSNHSWSTIVCDGPGELLLITPSLLRVVGVKQHHDVIQKISTNAINRPLDYALMRKMNFRQELQRLKKKLIGDELPV